MNISNIKVYKELGFLDLRPVARVDIVLGWSLNNLAPIPQGSKKYTCPLFPL